MNDLFTIGRSFIGERMENPRQVQEVLAEHARLSCEAGNYGVAALIMDAGGVIVSMGLNSALFPMYYNGELIPRDTSGHAEMNALRGFFEQKLLDDIGPYELWTNLQPCHMCGHGLLLSGMPAVYFNNDDAVRPYTQFYSAQMRELSRKLIKPYGPGVSHIFGDTSVSDPNLSRELDAVFKDSSEAVRRKKQAMETTAPAEMLDIVRQSSDSRSQEIIRRINMASPRGVHILGTRNENPENNARHLSDELVFLLARATAQSAKEGDQRNAAMALDPHGNLWFMALDRSNTENPLKTPIMRLYERIERMRSVMPPDLLSCTPLPGQFTIVSFLEPNAMEMARAASVYCSKLLYVQNDYKHGAISNGQFANFTDFYRIGRGLGDAVRTASNPQLDTIVNGCLEDIRNQDPHNAQEV